MKKFSFMLLVAVLIGVVSVVSTPKVAYADCGRTDSKTYWWGRQILLSHDKTQWIANSDPRPRDAVMGVIGMPGAALIISDWIFTQRMRDADRGCGIYLNLSWATYTMPGLLLVSRMGPQ
jgi:hypothetical protein